jgi:hypothetical protein
MLIVGSVRAVAAPLELIRSGGGDGGGAEPDAPRAGADAAGAPDPALLTS